MGFDRIFYGLTFTFTAPFMNTAFSFLGSTSPTIKHLLLMHNTCGGNGVKASNARLPDLQVSLLSAGKYSNSLPCIS